ncbi:hypothetical protein [Blastococcus aggregatus]|nr:hypothetical protein [Blastococcus aggregatus]
MALRTRRRPTAATGRRIDVEGVDMYVFRGDRVCRYQASYDTGTVARQLGLLPAHDSRTERVLVLLQRLLTAVRAVRP